MTSLDSGEPLARLDSLVKRYRTSRGRYQTALDRFSMSVPARSVVGLLGPNGSGKTTALKALLGLVRVDSGRIRAFGHELPRCQHLAARRTGALIEGPAFTASLTGEHNLRLLAALHGVPESTVAEVLDLVGLTRDARRAYSGYSLGMKQRLGVAAALLSSPDLLVLDEPMNGLDPEAIRDLRPLLTHLRDDRGMTVLVSSHILAEVELVCDHVTIVRHGRVITEGELSRLVGGASDHVVLRLPGPASLRDTARAVLTGRGIRVGTVDGSRDPAELRVETGERVPAVLRILAEHDIYPDGIHHRSASLEDVYIRAIRAADADRGETRHD
ncbi:ATP-binding cassette domain-containing protein [Streptomyces sudanensis]|uniref:ATP-binding cassette domain-containing protein n=1 Tax=Streptomyces sudanensis TaxID=436397 RepID=UPI0020CF7AB8|nr:ATP-binding cassette domain-containing protein [Streptomyces sudanensis]MCP9988841.1 ATP-binding cassette domain-containing protein [Streptomyces sudanensis]